MVASRAARELVAAGITRSDDMGMVCWLKIERFALDTWGHIKLLLRNPVKRRVWVLPTSDLVEPECRLAGLSALARQSTLA